MMDKNLITTTITNKTKMIYNPKFDIDKIDEKTLNEFRKSGVIVFGTGNYGILTLHALKQKNIKLICFVDNKVFT